MEELFLNKEHIGKFADMMNELGFEDLNDPYWRSLVYILSGDDRLFNERHTLVNIKGKEINSEIWFDGHLSGGEQRLLALAYNLFTNQDFYEFANGKKYYISPLEIFSGIDESGYKLAKNAMDVRLNFF
ncbi:hypothetical protein A5882_003687 [Enterococcus sp. 4E1_DIV0656]|uniref:DUF6075 family protein n=1 Tax=Enterococcus sp. 4E1_DIV0656 TaxID=1834180 RepID=UPI000A3A0A5A|nr:DUF6075 family protein [Enterococcus sp. 4E1_DIV0656]OTO09008.1 hypothetical protein A5882_003687 [Enterococcus sp. 4E1_DIV0656]